MSAITGEELLAMVERHKTERAASMPDAEAALKQIIAAVERLRDLGWRDGIYAPKDGTMFEAAMAGSTGTFKCYYSGEWPDGLFNTMDDGDVYPSTQAPLMFRLLRN